MSDERKAQVEALARPAPTIDERKARLEAAYEMVFALCHDVRRAWRMTIPVEPTDTDIVICAALTDARASLRELEALRAKWDAAPWEEIRWAAYQAGLFVEWTLDIKAVLDWCDANAPKEEEPQP